MSVNAICLRTLKTIIIFLILFQPATFYSQPAKKYVTIKGSEFVDTGGRPFLLKGINLGNWLNPEGYMFHLGSVSSSRLISDLINEAAGPEEAARFWKAFRDNYITRDDIHFIKQCGMNSVRVPFNFRLFADEQNPDVFYETGFEYLDRVVEWCRAEGLYVILDMHCAPGGQTGDNIDDSWGYPYLFRSSSMQDLTVSIWEKIALRYAGETAVIGYDLLNEPIAHYFGDKEELNKLLEPLYKRITSAIRKTDSEHIIFLGGAQWNTNFSVFGKPFDSRLAYTFHKYWMPPVQKEIQQYADFSRKYDVPMWLGESGENSDAWIDSFRTVLEKNKISWCFWPYKKMDSKSCMVSFSRTAEWDSLIAFAKSNRGTYEQIRKSRPAFSVSQKALADMIENMKFDRCRKNEGYLKALGVKK